MQTQDLTHALTHWADLESRIRAQLVAIFLDYDGTLTPIAARPQDATLRASTRAILAQLRELCPVAIVTGRGLADVQALVDLPQLDYAANHGFEIVGPWGEYRPYPDLPATFDQIARSLQPLVNELDGVVLEAKGFSVAVHYRLANPEGVDALTKAVDHAIASHAGVRKGEGKKVLEIRPALPWHKGAAVRWLRQRLDQRTPHLPMFLGDDRTDEDALAEVADTGIGIFVGTPGSWVTQATHRVADVGEATEFLERVLQALVSQRKPSR